MSSEDLRNATILIYANKQDMPDAMDIAELTEKLGLRNIRQHNWYIQGASAKTGDGLDEGISFGLLCSF